MLSANKINLSAISFGICKGLFAVLGGPFGESIDLIGDRLIGPSNITLGLPQMNEVNEQMRILMQEVFGLEHDHTYLYQAYKK